LKATILAAYQASADAYNAATTDPANPDLRAQVEATRSGFTLAQTLLNLDALVEKGWRARPNPGVPATDRVESDVTLIGSPPTQAQFTSCSINSYILYKPGGAPDGGDLTVNDQVTARRYLITMELGADGRWRESTGVKQGEWKDSAACGA
jgi:hypothetical protein